MSVRYSSFISSFIGIPGSFPHSPVTSSLFVVMPSLTLMYPHYVCDTTHGGNCSRICQTRKDTSKFFTVTRSFPRCPAIFLPLNTFPGSYMAGSGSLAGWIFAPEWRAIWDLTCSVMGALQPEGFCIGTRDLALPCGTSRPVGLGVTMCGTTTLEVPPFHHSLKTLSNSSICEDRVSRGAPTENDEKLTMFPPHPLSAQARNVLQRSLCLAPEEHPLSP